MRRDVGPWNVPRGRRSLFAVPRATRHSRGPLTNASRRPSGRLPGLSEAAVGDAGRDSGLAWAEGTLWVGQYQDRKIHQTGAILRTIESNRFVTGVTWVDGELWHGTWEGDDADIRQVDPDTGAVLTRLTMPRGTGVSGLESDQGELLYAGGGESGRVRAVRRPRRRSGVNT